VKVRYHESFLFPQGQEDFGRSLVFPQGQLHGLSGPYSKEREDLLVVIGEVGGYQIVTANSAIAALAPSFYDPVTTYPIAFGTMPHQLEAYLRVFGEDKYLVRGSYRETALQDQARAQGIAKPVRDPEAEKLAAQQAAAQQAAAQQAAAAARQAEEAQKAAALQATGFKVIGSVSGFNEDKSVRIDYKIVTAESAIAALQPLWGNQEGPSTWSFDDLETGLLGRLGLRNYLVKGSTLENKLSGQQAAAQQAAAAAQIQATSQAAAQTAAAAAAAKPEVSMATSSSVISFDDARSILSSKGKYTQGMTAPQMSAILTADQGGNPVKIETYYGYKDAESILRSINSWVEGMSIDQIRAKLTAWNDFNPVIVNDPKQTAAAVAATTTQTTATNTATGTVQTIDKVTGTTSTANAATGKVIVTLTDGQIAQARGTVTAGGVTTTVDPKTGVVTTQNTQTGVATQTDPKTGKTVTATQVTGTSTTGGTFVLPDGKTVTTNQPITSTGEPGELDLGKIALFGLLGLLLLRGAVR
jgi:hypothetical protein